LQTCAYTNLAVPYSLLPNPNGGNVGVGTTGPNHQLHVVSNNNNLNLDTPAVNQSATMRFYDGGNARWGIFTSADVSHNLTFYSNGAGAAAMTAGAGVIVGAPTGGLLGTGKLNAVEVRANNVVLTSDVELKTDIENLPKCLPLVAAIEPKSFRWKKLPEPAPVEGPDGEMMVQPSGPSDFAEKLNRGFLAQEVSAVLGGSAESVDLGGLVAVLWQAVREMTARIAALEAR
jgi:hypothetical protein